MAQAITRQLLIELGGEAQEAQIIQLAYQKHYFESTVNIQGLINRDLANLKKWGEVIKIARGRWRISSKSTKRNAYTTLKNKSKENEVKLNE
jgi:hypothetical protein